MYKHFLIKNNRENQKNDHSFPYLSISLLYQTFFVQAKSNGPNKCKHEISDSLHYSFRLILFCYTNLRTDPHVNKDFFLFEFFSKDSLTCSKVGATHV